MNDIRHRWRWRFPSPNINMIFHIGSPEVVSFRRIIASMKRIYRYIGQLEMRLFPRQGNEPHGSSYFVQSLPAFFIDPRIIPTSLTVFIENEISGKTVLMKRTPRACIGYNTTGSCPSLCVKIVLSMWGPEAFKQFEGKTSR